MPYMKDDLRDPSLSRLPRIVPRGVGKPLILIAAATASCALLVTLSVRLIDRPVATWVHQHLGDSRFAFTRMSYEGHLLPIGPFSLMAGPAQVIGPFALIVLVGLVVALAAGWRPTLSGYFVLALATSILVSLAINQQLKYAFGRTWPESWLGNNPSWVRDGVFGFFPFHGGAGWGSFPSGHTTVITTPAAFLWRIRPATRPVCAAVVALIAVGLLGAGYHFVSDIIGGLYVGAAIGLGTANLFSSCNLRNRSICPPGPTDARSIDSIV